MLSKSIVTQETERCFLCGTTIGLEEHHIFFGTANRKLSEKYGLTVPLCHGCHRTNPHAVHRNRKYDVELKQIAQRCFERNYSHELFMDEFGRNYI